MTAIRRVDEVPSGDRALFDLAAEAAGEAPYPAWLIKELRSDHAGETGAVNIYRGAALVSRDPELKKQIAEHLHHEKDHLTAIEMMLEPKERSVFLPLWRLSGWGLGMAGALFGAKSHAVTVDAVETFVDQHYGEQIGRLEQDGGFPATLAVLRICREDEVVHRDEARDALPHARSILAKVWAKIVGGGSAGAVVLARWR